MRPVVFWAFVHALSLVWLLIAAIVRGDLVVAVCAGVVAGVSETVLVRRLKAGP